MTTLYTDLSHHDWNRAKGELNFSLIRQSTSRAVCIRATYGDPQGVHYPTQHFGDMTKAARAAGIQLLGAYHNLVRGDQASINRQVDWLRSEMDKHGSNWAMLDVERYDELLQANNHPRWDDVQRFHDRWAAVDKRVLAFYIPDWVWAASLGSHSLTGLRGPLVASEYGSNLTGLNPSGLYARQGGDTSALWHSYGGRSPDMLQYGSNCACPGASGQTDVNAFRGSFAELTALLTRQETDVTTERVLTTADLESIRKVVWQTDNAVLAPTGWPEADNPMLRGDTLPRSTWEKVDRLEQAIQAVAVQLGGDLVDEAAIADAFLARLATKPIDELAAGLSAVLTEQQVVDLVTALRRAEFPPPVPGPVVVTPPVTGV